jgi:ferredoxin
MKKYSRNFRNLFKKKFIPSFLSAINKWQNRNKNDPGSVNFRLIQRENDMKVRIEDNCISCGLCVSICPDVFTMGDQIAEGLVDIVPPDLEGLVQQAANECPVEAIIIE